MSDKQPAESISPKTMDHTDNHRLATRLLPGGSDLQRTDLIKALKEARMSVSFGRGQMFEQMITELAKKCTDPDTGLDNEKFLIDLERLRQRGIVAVMNELDWETNGAVSLVKEQGQKEFEINSDQAVRLRSLYILEQDILPDQMEAYKAALLGASKKVEGIEQLCGEYLAAGLGKDDIAQLIQRGVMQSTFDKAVKEIQDGLLDFSREKLKNVMETLGLGHGWVELKREIEKESDFEKKRQKYKEKLEGLSVEVIKQKRLDRYYPQVQVPEEWRRKDMDMPEVVERLAKSENPEIKIQKRKAKFEWEGREYEFDYTIVDAPVTETARAMGVQNVEGMGAWFANNLGLGIPRVPLIVRTSDIGPNALDGAAEFNAGWTANSLDMVNLRYNNGSPSWAELALTQTDRVIVYPSQGFAGAYPAGELKRAWKDEWNDEVFDVLERMSRRVGMDFVTLRDKQTRRQSLTALIRRSFNSYAASELYKVFGDMFGRPALAFGHSRGGDELGQRTSVDLELLGVLLKPASGKELLGKKITEEFRQEMKSLRGTNPLVYSMIGNFLALEGIIRVGNYGSLENVNLVGMLSGLVTQILTADNTLGDAAREIPRSHYGVINDPNAMAIVGAVAIGNLAFGDRQGNSDEYKMLRNGRPLEFRASGDRLSVKGSVDAFTDENYLWNALSLGPWLHPELRGQEVRMALEMVNSYVVEVDGGHYTFVGKKAREIFSRCMQYVRENTMTDPREKDLVRALVERDDTWIRLVDGRLWDANFYGGTPGEQWERQKALELGLNVITLRDPDLTRIRRELYRTQGIDIWELWERKKEGLTQGGYYEV